MGYAWTQEEDDMLLYLRSKGLSFQSICNIIKKPSMPSVRYRWNKIKNGNFKTRKKAESIRKWGAGEKSMLHKLWSEGNSASVIRDKLNHKFNNARTRNGVIGQVHRLGLKPRISPIHISLSFPEPLDVYD
jgi:hypothetical protein